MFATTGALISRIKSVRAIANTASQNASNLELVDSSDIIWAVLTLKIMYTTEIVFGPANRLL